MKSLSEIETTSKRASKAAGFSWGEAEEIGKNIRLLELFGFKGIKNLNHYYNLKNKENFENLNLISKINNSKRYPFCPIIFGISFLDQIKTIEKFQKIKINQVSFPILILPFLSRSSEVIGKKIKFRFNQIELQFNFNINIMSNIMNEDLPIIANEVEIDIIENIDSFSDQEWKSLYKLSEETFVEETDRLKKAAAGAGLTDND